MTVLLLFNHVGSMTVEAILDGTNIEAGLLVQVLLSLLKSKLLKCQEINTDDLSDDLQESDLRKNYTIEINESFTRFDISF